MRKLGYIVHKIDTLSEWSGRGLFLLILVMIGTIMFEVVSRYLFNRPTMWSLDASTMVYGTYMIGAGAYALLHGAHIKMDLFYARWSKRTKAIVDVCTFPLFLLFGSILLWKSGIYGWQSFMRLEHAVTAWSPPIYYWKMTVPAAVLLILLQGVSKFIRDLTFAVSSKELK